LEDSNTSRNQQQCLRVEMEIPNCDSETVETLLWDLDTLGYEEQIVCQHTLFTAYFLQTTIDVLKNALKRKFEQYHLTVPDCQVCAFDYDERDWLKSYREYFKPFPVGSTFYIYPEWEKPSDQFPINILIDPGHAFGTGTHESTRLSLLFLEDLVKDADSVLDFGTGAGILSVAARKLNSTAMIVAFDIDPTAVECAVRSFVLNKTNQIQYFTGRSDSLIGQFEVLVANLTAYIHRSVSNELTRLSKEHLILSGITTEQREFTLDQFQSSNMKLVDEKEENGWLALYLKRDN